MHKNRYPSIDGFNQYAISAQKSCSIWKATWIATKSSISDDSYRAWISLSFFCRTHFHCLSISWVFRISAITSFFNAILFSISLIFNSIILLLYPFSLLQLSFSVLQSEVPHLTIAVCIIGPFPAKSCMFQYLLWSIIFFKK